ncbi:MAG: outer membrane lipoprotein-sorting protein [Gammaproteobacteria bacterium]|nr:outer membrane lipoprotein-sorting protein [Gammaproteobacteria bacterium]
MNTKLFLHATLMLGLTAGATTAFAADVANMTVNDIAQCMRQNVVERGSLRDFQVNAFDAEGKSNNLKVKVFWKPAKTSDESRMTLQVLEPDTYAGTAYLLASDGQSEQINLYLPALKRVQPVVGSEMTQKLWGSDFTFADVKQVQGLLVDGNAKRLADAAVSGRPTYLVETATDKSQTGYSMVRSYIDQQSCTMLKAELFADGTTPTKVLTGDLNRLVEVEPYWVMLGYTMNDLKAGTHTDLVLSDVYLLERGLPESLFTPEGFYQPYE